MFKKTLASLGIALFSLATVLPAGAQEVATLALRNGERPTGELVDMTGSAYVLRVNGQDRSFSTGDVAAIEFVVGPLSAEAQAKVNAGQPVIVLRNGQVIDGRITDIGGARPLRITVDTAGGSRDFSSSDIAQVHLAPMSGAAPGAAAAATSGTNVPVEIPANALTIPANQAWTDSGVTVRRGTRFTITAWGDVMISPTASSGPNGSPAVTSPAARYPLQSAPAGTLIARIGTGTPFVIGTGGSVVEMPTSGRLMFGVNDDALGDNTGSFQVSIARASR